MNHFPFALLLMASLLLTACGGLIIGDPDGQQFDLGAIFSSATKAFGGVSEKEESKIGKQGAAVLLGAVKLENNPRLQAYVNRVGSWVIQQTSRSNKQWHFAVLATDDVNAFAAPGGYIFVTRGLLKQLNSEAELAGVLAHESVHVLKQHHLKAVQKQAKLDLASALLSSAAKSSEQRDNLRKITGGFKELYSRGLDKDDEFEADRLGLVIAARAGYDPYGLVAVLQKLDRMNPEDASLALMFKTHPPALDRLNKINNSIIQRLDKYSNQKVLSNRYMAQLK